MKSICVYCGSSPGSKPGYIKSAQSLGKQLVKRNVDLVYGGANIGVMGAIANSVLDNGGRVIGVIPEALCQLEVAHQGLTELKIVSDMHERKFNMAELADGFISLPGGLGTLEELFEMLTWSQLGFHNKPIGLLNIDSYYDHLIKFIAHAIDQGFVKQAHRQLLCISSDVDELLNLMQDFQSPKTSKV